MSNVLGLRGLSTPNINTLIAAYGNGFVNLNDGSGYGIPITPNQNVEFEVFLQSIFYQNFIDRPLTFDGTVWSTKHVAKVPIAKYIRRWQGAMYLGYIKILGTDYPSRIWKSDLPKNNTIQWGFESGTNLSSISGNPLVSSANSGFKTYNIKRGDPFIITTGPNAGEYSVKSVSDDQQIILTTPLQYTSSGDSFFCGGNYFDVERDDGDFITWVGDNNSYFYKQLMIYKRDSLHRYDGQRLTQVQGAPGTTSGRSVVNIKELNLYFYGASGLDTGIYAYDNRDSIKISSPVEDHIQGIDPANYDKIIGWRERNLARMYVGNIVNTDKGINVPNAVITYDYPTKAWSVDPIADVVVCSTEFRQGNVKSVYFGTNTDAVMKTPSGNSFNGQPITWSFSTHVFYPLGTAYVNEFTRVQILSENAGGVIVRYKLHLTPFTTWSEFEGLGSIKEERTEFKLPLGKSQASGIEFLFLGTDTMKATALIKKISIFYKKGTTVIQ